MHTSWWKVHTLLSKNSKKRRNLQAIKGEPSHELNFENFKNDGFGEFTMGSMILNKFNGIAFIIISILLLN